MFTYKKSHIDFNLPISKVSDSLYKVLSDNVGSTFIVQTIGNEKRSIPHVLQCMRMNENTLLRLHDLFVRLPTFRCELFKSKHHGRIGKLAGFVVYEKSTLEDGIIEFEYKRNSNIPLDATGNNHHPIEQKAFMLLGAHLDD
jgi:hypothetical protein